MKIGVLRESKEKERRVALTPELVKQLIRKEFSIVVEEGAGAASNFTDETTVRQELRWPGNRRFARPTSSLK